MVSPVIVLEFNELTPHLMDRFIEAGALPAFARLRGESLRFITEANEDAEHLEPWIQWVTVHTGLPFAEHQLFNLDEGHKLRCPCIWDELASVGMVSWVCGSMNAVSSDPRVHLLPDPWASKATPSPPALRDFWSFVRAQVSDHDNDHAALEMAQYWKFASFLAMHGLSRGSVVAAARQLATERMKDSRWQRAALLDRFQLDVFAHYYRRLQPAFATLFLNSTAHYQHAYWEDMSPEAYGHTGGRASRRHAVQFGYEQMDGRLAEILQWVPPDATIVLCTALSQQPWVDHQERGGGQRYRPKDIAGLLRLAKVEDAQGIAPVMAEQFHVDFPSPAAAEAGGARLDQVSFDSRRLFAWRRDGSRLFVGCQHHHSVDARATLVVGGKTVPFFSVLFQVPTTKTATHHPDGMLWIRGSSVGRGNRGRIPLTAVAPTLLRLCGRPPGFHMKESPADLGSHAQ